MRGYLNFFENECNFIVDTAYVIKSGSVVLVCSGEHEGKSAIYDKENGVAILTIDGQVVSKIQGIMLEVQESDLKKRYGEES